MKIYGVLTYTQAPACADSGEGGRGGAFSSKSHFFAVFGLRSGPDGSGQAVGFIWPLFRAKRSILDPFRTKFDVFGPDRNFGQPGFGLGLAAPGCWLLLADPDHEIQDFGHFLLEKLKVFCQSPFEPSTLRGVFEGDINCDCIFTRTLSCHACLLGSRLGQPPLHQTVRTPQLKLFGE